MGEYEEEGQYSPEELQEYRDRRGDYSLPTNWNLAHLTLSPIALKFFEDRTILNDLLPLVDQIMATSYLDERGVDLFRCMINSQILEIMLWSDEEAEEDFNALDTARIYLFMLLEGMKKGYRGKLATELRRVYRREQEEAPKKKGWFR